MECNNTILLGFVLQEIVALFDGTITTHTTTATSPIQQCIVLSTIVIVATFVISEITKNYSQVDKLWSVLPVIYAWILVCDERTLLMAVLTTIWGIRLTRNFYGRGGYKFPDFWNGDEDYRYKYVRKGFAWSKLRGGTLLWTAFNLGFISIYQNFLLLVMVAPSLYVHVIATKGSICKTIDDYPFYNASLNAMDIVNSILFLAFVLLESVADHQQNTFQKEKYKRRQQSLDATGEQSLLLSGEYADGFTRSGLFSIVRKPNYAAEQAIWIVYHLFSVSCCNSPFPLTLFNWSAIGYVLLVLLFQQSGPLTERITLTKYPKYEEYMRTTPMYVPNPLQWMSQHDGSNNKND